MMDLLNATVACVRSFDRRLADTYRRDFKAWVVRTHITELTQLQQLNRYWRLELGLLSVSTIAARECLLDDTDPDIWINNFSIYVMPHIAAFAQRSLLEP